MLSSWKETHRVRGGKGSPSNVKGVHRQGQVGHSLAIPQLSPGKEVKGGNVGQEAPSYTKA